MNAPSNKPVNISSHMEQKQQPNATSGAGMDRKIERKVNPLKKWGGVGIGFFLLVAVVIYLAKQPAGKSLAVAGERLVVSSVTQGKFEDFIPVRGRVTPARTVFLDAIEGGRVERILVEDGATLKAGDLIAELSNAQLQLSVLGNEARVAEQLNNIRTLELRLEQNRLAHKRNLIDINHQIKLLKRQLERERPLLGTGAIIQSQFDDTVDTLNWYLQRREITLESQASDAEMQQSQLTFLHQTGTRLENNLEISKQNLENMNVRAPVDGVLSGFDIEIGQSIGRGERLGQIDTPSNYKLTALIDEFYLGRVDLGQTAQVERDGTSYQLVISKIYPEVRNGQFEVDLKFTGNQPANIQRGQTLNTKLTLGDATDALLLRNGAFYQETGGRWVFVVSNDGQTAERRQVRLGRKNSQFIEVLEGLELGEQVITSPYNNYQDMQRLTLK